MHLMWSQIEKVHKPLNCLATSQECIVNKTDEVIGGGEYRHPVGHVPHKMVFELKDDGVGVAVQFLKGQCPFILDFV
jgi:hypothetical protein